jgi:hypothetical protein
MSFEECVQLGREAVRADDAAQDAIRKFRKAWDELKIGSESLEKQQADLWAEMIKPAMPEAQPQAVPADAVEPATSQPPREPPQRLADSARCVPTPPHWERGLSESAKRYLEGR